MIMDYVRCGRQVLKYKTSDVMLCDFAFFHKLTGEMKGGHLNDFDELRLKSSEIIYFHPTEWFDQVALYGQWIKYVERHRKGIAPQGAYF